jgi:hypothetical protein
VPAQVLPVTGTISPPLAARRLSLRMGNPPLCSRRAVIRTYRCRRTLVPIRRQYIALGISTYHRCGLRNTRSILSASGRGWYVPSRRCDHRIVSQTPWAQSSKDTAPCTRVFESDIPRCLRHSLVYMTYFQTIVGGLMKDNLSPSILTVVVMLPEHGYWFAGWRWNVGRNLVSILHT